MFLKLRHVNNEGSLFFIFFWVTKKITKKKKTKCGTMVWNLPPPQIFTTLFGSIIFLQMGVPLVIIFTINITMKVKTKGPTLRGETGDHFCIFLLFVMDDHFCLCFSCKIDFSFENLWKIAIILMNFSNRKSILYVKHNQK